MEEGLDTGDVLVERDLKIDSNDNLQTLTKKLSDLSSKLIMNAISKIEETKDGDINFLLKKQSDFNRELKYARMINKSDYIINWENNSIDIYRKINALYPRANTIYKKKNLKIIKIKILKTEDLNKENKESITNDCIPGLIIGILENEGIVISTNTEPIILLEAKLEGKNISSKNKLIQQLSPVVGEKFSD